MKFYSFLLIILFQFGCKDSGPKPENYLSSFIEYRFKSGQNKQQILSQLTGPMYAEFEQMSDEEFDILMQTNQLKLNNLDITGKKCSEKTCYITYNLDYYILDAEKKDQKKSLTYIKKIAEMKLEGKTWKIHDIRNIKTIHDSNDSILIRSIR